MDSTLLDNSILQTILKLGGILLLVMLNGFFAFAEIAVVSAKKVRLRQMAPNDRGAAAALELADDPNDFLSTVQIGITLVGILAGALSGAALAEEFAVWLRYIPFLAPSAETISFVLAVLLVTYLSLVIGELVPKAIALNDPEGSAARVARPLQLLARFSSPLVKLLSKSTTQLLTWLKLPVSDEPPVTEEELKALAAEGVRTGVLEPAERHLVQQALELDDISLRPLITHRTKVEWIDITESTAQIYRLIKAHPYTWFPLCQGSMDQVVGIVRARDILLKLAEDGKISEDEVIDVQALAYPPHFVPLTATPVAVIETFRNSEIHMAFAIDEYGGVEGIVTPFDILRKLVSPPEEQLIEEEG